jgi:hypothetical protein
MRVVDGSLLFVHLFFFCCLGTHAYVILELPPDLASNNIFGTCYYCRALASIALLKVLWFKVEI